MIGSVMFILLDSKVGKKFIFLFSCFVLVSNISVSQVHQKDHDYVSTENTEVQLTDGQTSRLVRSYSKKIKNLTSRLRSTNNKFLHCYMKEEDALLHKLCYLELPPDFEQAKEPPKIINSGEGFPSQAEPENMNWLNIPSIQIERPKADVLADGLMMDCWYSFNRFENISQRESGMKPSKKSNELDSINLAISKLEKQHPINKSDYSSLRKEIAELEKERKRTELIKDYISEQQDYLSEVLAGIPGANLLLKPLRITSGYFNAQVKENLSLFHDRSRIQELMLKRLRIPNANDLALDGSEVFSKNVSIPSQALKGSNGELMTIDELMSSATSKAIEKDKVPQTLNEQASNETLYKKNDLNPDQLRHETKDTLTSWKNETKELKQKSDENKVKLNPLKTKRIIDRFKLNFNFQLDPSTRFFPSSGTITFGIGYQYHPSGNIGASLLYNQPLPKGVFNSETRNLLPYSTGYGLRSFADFKLKGNVFLMYGYDWMMKSKSINNSPNIGELEMTRSALAGLKIKTKLKSKRITPSMEILYDFLHQSTGQPALVTRMGFDLTRKHGIK